MLRDHRHNPTPAPVIVAPPQRDPLTNFLASLRPDQLGELQQVVEDYSTRDPLAFLLDVAEGVRGEIEERVSVERDRYPLEF